jgi:hypothetical protein
VAGTHTGAANFPPCFAENLEQNGAENSSDGGHFMPRSTDADFEADFPTTRTEIPGESASGSASGAARAL